MAQVAVKLPGCQALRRQHAPCGAFPVSATCSGRGPLGCHSKPSRNRIKHLVVPAAAVPALAGVAAAVCLAPQALADPAPAPASASAPTQATASGSYSGASGSYQACVIARESGGNSQVMNSSGHYGLYQFSASTWQAYGGSAADFGHASVAEQNRVFNSAIAQGGQSNWSPYDGC